MVDSRRNVCPILIPLLAASISFFKDKDGDKLGDGDGNEMGKTVLFFIFLGWAISAMYTSPEGVGFSVVTSIWIKFLSRDS